MTDTIICTAVLQPHAYGRDASKYTVSASLNFACRASAYSPSISEYDARDRFEWFLRAVPGVKFRVFRRAGAPSSPPEHLEPAGWTATEDNPPPQPTPAGNIMDWLECWRETRKLHDYWVSTDPTTASPPDTDYRVRVKVVDLQATHVLGAAAGWPAPLPQNAGLVRILTLTPTMASPPLTSPPHDDLGDLIIVPFFDDKYDFHPRDFQHIPQGTDPSHDLIRFTYDAGEEFLDATAEVRFLDVHAMNATGLMDIDNGFLVAPSNSDDAGRVTEILKRIENRSASLFWAFPAVQAISWNDAPIHSPPPAAMTRLVWRAMNGLATLLDPVVLSLVMPSPPAVSSADSRAPNPDGPFVSALAACLEDARKNGILSPAPKPYVLTTFVETGLRDFLSVDVVENIDRTKVVATLNQLLEVFSPGDKTTFDANDPKTTVQVAPNFLWLLMNCYVAFSSPGAAADVLSTFLAEAVKRFGSGGKEETLEIALNNELGALAHKIQADGGIEQLAIKLLEGIKLLDENTLAGAVGVDPQRVARTAIASFRTFLTRNFNALDAVRHAQARLYELHLVSAAARPKPRGGVAERWTWRDLTRVMYEARWFARRIDPRMPGTFDQLGEVLPIYARSWVADDELSFVTAALTREFGAICHDLIPRKHGQRLVPDHAPQSLPVQIAVDSDLKHLEDFMHAYSGIGVLVRRAGEDWAYADLAELELFEGCDTSPKTNDYQPVKESQSPASNLITIVPLQPVAVDDQISLFLQYDGLPFTSRAFVDTRAAGTGLSDIVLPFFKIDDPPARDLGAAGFARLLPLAYGEAYDIAAFVLGKGGALPRSIQAPAAPWAPDPISHVPSDIAGKKYARRYPYQRTTAIGRVTLNESGTVKRIGADIANVQPLFRDYPRVGLSAGDKWAAVLDVLRNPDGSGALSLPQPEPHGSPHYSPPAVSPPGAGKATSITLSDLWWWGGPGRLTISLFAAPDVLPTADGELIWTFAVNDAFAGASLTFEVSRTDSDGYPAFTFTCHLSDANAAAPAPAATQVIDVDRLGSAEAIWLRFAISSSSSPAQPIALSLSDPATADGRVTSRPAGDSLVLIAPNTAEWRSPYGSTVTADIIYPRVGFNDFDRWLNNPGLAEEAMASTGHEPTGPDRDRFNKFRRLLMTAYVGRHLHPSLGPLIDSLPDLAVDRLLIELTPLDALYDEPSDVVSPDQELMESISRPLPLKTLVQRLPVTLPDPDQVTEAQELVDLLAALSKASTGSLVVQSGDRGKLSIDLDRNGVLIVTVPRGMVARLSIRPMVHERYLQQPASPPGIAIFREDIATLATEKQGDHFVFEGASLVIESMLGVLAKQQPKLWMDTIAPDNNRSYEWENLVAKAVVVRPAGAHRSYDLVARPADLKAEARGWWWRQLARVDVETQRWRFTGRPIYSWLNPKNAQNKKNGQATLSDVAIEQTWSQDATTATLDAITRFEEEIFFDRDEADADTRTTQLSPVPHETVLQSFPWEQPSATYFRHRLTIRSRYEGALARSEVAVQRAWGEDSDFKDDRLREQRLARSWIRVAMLADRTRLQLTRPQLCALIPLTVSPATPDDETLPTTPPIMAILDERPFARGGLADRIAAEIRTGLGYELPKGEPLGIADARKEFGPDARLTYTPASEEVARSLTLRNEGPVGLTFDSDNVRAAVFANTALVLHPTVLSSMQPAAASLEEYFGSVALRRYLDPAWLTTEAVADYAIKNQLWIIWHITDLGHGFRLGVDGAIQSRDLISVNEEGGIWNVSFDAALIDPLPQESESGSPSNYSPMLSPAPNFKPLCSIYAGAISGLIFLHLPLEKGRASLSVFAQPSGTPASLGDLAVLAGDANQPLMMGSIEWQVPLGSTHLWVDDDALVNLTSASPTTLMNWTRTGRNFELWHATKGGDFAPYKSSNVVARWTDNTKNSCKFFDVRDSANGNPLNFEPRSGRYPNPLYVQRHHAIIATRNAKGIGRPVEVFTGIRRVFGGPFSPPSDTQALRLVEFETPARPLAWFSGIARDAIADFQTAHFDLVSIWGNAMASSHLGSPAPDSGFSLFIRPLGGDATNKALTELVLQLHVRLPLPSTQTPTDKTIKIRLPQDSTRPVRSIILIVTHLGDQPDITGQVFYLGGRVATAQVEISGANAADNLPALKLMSVSMKTGMGTPTEFWTDVSVLTLPRFSNAVVDVKDPANFTFDWLFTGDGALSPADAIKEAALREMVEAQARIIAVSPPIAVED